MREEIKQGCQETTSSRLASVLRQLGISSSSWYRKEASQEEKKKPGPKPKAIPGEVENGVVKMAELNPWYGYQRIAVMCRWAGFEVNNRQAYRVMKKHKLLQRRRSRKPELHQASKLYELLPQGPNELWQMDVTYIHIPGFGWWYAVTVIDYYSRYLLACHLTWSYSAAQVIEALQLARARAEQIHGPLSKPPFLVTDNGSSFIARRFADHVKDLYAHVRIQYRTPTQLGLLERMHRTLKEEEVYWRIYDDPQHARQCLEEFRTRYNSQRPHWALVPAAGGDPVTPEAVYIDGERTQIPKWQGWAKGAKKRLEQLMEEEDAA